MFASLPAFHLRFSFTQPLATTATAIVSPFSRHVRSMSLSHTLSGDGSAAWERLESHQRRQCRRARWYVTRLMCKRRVRLIGIYFDHQGKCGAEEPLVDCLARIDRPKSVSATQQQQRPFVQLSTRSLPSLLSHLRMDRQVSFPLSLPQGKLLQPPFSFSFDGQSQQQ